MSETGSSCLNLGALGQFKGIFDIDAEVANGALNLRMTEENLNCSRIACRLIDDGGLCSPKRAGAIFLWLEADTRTHS